MKTTLSNQSPLGFLALCVLGALIPAGSAHARTEGLATAEISSNVIRAPLSVATIRRYLARAITMQGLANPNHADEATQHQDDLGVIARTRPLFIGRFAGWWGSSNNTQSDGWHFNDAKTLAENIHAVDPNIVLEAAIFEYIDGGVSQIEIPRWVFEAFQLPVENRNFDFYRMVFADFPSAAHGQDGAGKNAVPDLSKLETRMWFYYRARRYIDSGAEALHMGQIHLTAENDPNHVLTWGLFKMIREYAAQKARRRFVWINAHTPYPEDATYHLPNDYKKLSLDFAEFPLMQKGTSRNNVLREAVLEKNFLNSIYGKSAGGVTPGGEYTQHLPYLVEFDNYGISDHPGKYRKDDHFVYGYDEITWFSLLGSNDRNNWLRYATNWVAQNDGNGHVEMPGVRNTNPVAGVWPEPMYRASRNFGNQEATISDIWDHPAARTPANVCSLAAVCPLGNFDGANCDFGATPPGKDPFIHQNQFYFKPELRRCDTGSFDGANCYQSAVPSGAKPFVYENRFYYEAFANRCPGASFDGANCRVSSAPANSRPFIYGNAFYTQRVNGVCTAGTFDGANCYVGRPPNGASAFLWNNSFYFKPLTQSQAAAGCSNNGVCCPVGQFDGANCYVGSATSGTRAFIHGNSFYSTPRFAQASSCATDGLCCPDAQFDGANCHLNIQPPSGTAAFIWNGRYYSEPSCK